MRTLTLLFLTSLVACSLRGTPVTPPAPSNTSGADAAACNACIESGRTWQPEVSECTEDCDVQDISCYADSCPGSCADECGNCFSQSECEANSCTWHQEQEAMWCTQ